MKTEGSEKRYYGRIPFTLQVKGKVTSAAGEKRRFKCISEDIGFYGLRLKVPENSHYQPGQQVRLKIRLYRGDFFLRARGKVCWVGHSPKTASHMNLGIRLTRIRRFTAWCDRINREFRRHTLKNTEGSAICLQDQQDY